MSLQLNFPLIFFTVYLYELTTCSKGTLNKVCAQRYTYFLEMTFADIDDGNGNELRADKIYQRNYQASGNRKDCNNNSRNDDNGDKKLAKSSNG